MGIKHFFNIYSPRKIWSKVCLSIANLPMFPTIRPKIIKLAGVDVDGSAWIYRNVTFDRVAPDHIHIGNGTTITEGCKILTHYLDPNFHGRRYRIGEVWIGDNVFLGVNVVICNSVNVGNGAIVGAGSIVTNDIPPYEVWAGNPARFIKKRPTK